MPWLYNPDRSQVQIVKADGQAAAIPGRTRIYVDPANMSADIGAKLASRALVNKGGDPAPAVELAPPFVSHDDLGISSDSHEDTDIVLSDLVADTGADAASTQSSDEIYIADELEEDSAIGDSQDDSSPETTNYGKRRKRKRR